MAVSAMDYFDDLERYVGIDYGDRSEFCMSSLSIMDELAERKAICRKTYLQIKSAVCSGKSCKLEGINAKDVSMLVEKVGRVMKGFTRE